MAQDTAFRGIKSLVVVVGGGVESENSVCPRPSLQLLQFLVSSGCVRLRQVMSVYVGGTGCGARQYLKESLSMMNKTSLKWPSYFIFHPSPFNLHLYHSSFISRLLSFSDCYKTAEKHQGRREVSFLTFHANNVLSVLNPSPLDRIAPLYPLHYYLYFKSTEESH